MVDAFTVDPDALDNDAVVWREWKADLKKVGSSVPTVGSDLDGHAFSKLPGADNVLRAYKSVSLALEDAIDTGATQFGGMADKITKVAGLYRDAEESNLEDISATREEVDAL
ncbi:MAG: hypothetical protein ACOH1T_09400 [Microbacteriaceae bacterium]